MTTQLRIVALILIVAAIVIREPLLGAAAFILAGATLVTAWWTTRVERGLRVRYTVPETVNFGDRATVTIAVENTALVAAPWLQIADILPLMLRTGPPTRLALALGAAQSRAFSYEVHGARGGYYQLGPLRLVTGDVLGLHTRQLVTPRAELTVFPRVVPLQRLSLPAQMLFGPLPSRLRRGEDPARPAGVRPYQASDGVRRLDWKSTARHGELLVRRAEPTVAPETTLALAFGRADYPARIFQDCLERAATTAASLGTALIARKLPVALISNGADPKNPGKTVILPHGKGDGHRQLLLYVLGRLDAGEGGTLWDTVAEHALPWGGTLILITADLDVDALPRIEAIRRRGQHVVALLLEPTPAGLALARRQRVAAYPVDREGVPLVAV